MAEKVLKTRALARGVRFVALSVAALGVAACAAILGIDERTAIDGAGDEAGGSADAPSGTGDGGPDGRSDGTVELDAAADAPPAKCDPGTCATAGGICDATETCVVACATGCNGKVVNCPPGAACKVQCNAANACAGVKCVGGRSCTLECSGPASCKQGVACESERCDIRCTGSPDSCRDGTPITCDASVCIVDCAGSSSCNEGITANATAYCGITCSGSPSCNKMASAISCGASPDASIVCANAMDTCKDGKPTCQGGAFCSVECRHPTSCSNGYCCEAGTCTGNVGARKNVCP